MSRLPMMSGDDFVRAIRQVGYVWDHAEGSHMILSMRQNAGFPYHVTQSWDEEILRKLIEQAGMTRDEFQRLL